MQTTSSIAYRLAPRANQQELNLDAHTHEVQVPSYNLDNKALHWHLACNTFPTMHTEPVQHPTVVTDLPKGHGLEHSCNGGRDLTREWPIHHGRLQ